MEIRWGWGRHALGPSSLLQPAQFREAVGDNNMSSEARWPVSSVTSCGPDLGHSLNFSMPQFPPLYKEDDNGCTCFSGLLGE